MKTAERVVMVAILLVITGGIAFVYFTMKANHQAILDGVARGEYEIRPETPAAVALSEVPTDKEEWEKIYPNTIPMMIASTSVSASVADTLPERMQGLSGTPYLPPNVVKLFVFGAAGSHSIWMKDMRYAIDIMWVDDSGKIVHIEEAITPETFPKSFASPVPAWYVIEAAAGFVDTNQIVVGDRITTPSTEGELSL